MRTLFPASTVVAATLLSSACEHSSPVGPSALTSTDALVLALQQQGATVRRGDVLPAALPCLSSTSAHVVFVNTGLINSFEYPSVDAAARDAARISPAGAGVTGSGCEALILWVGPPHFYKRDQLIVVYAGTADDVLRPLQAVLGEPFASR